MGDKKYSILHCHTMLSSGTTNIDSVTRFQEYINKAKDDGLYNITFTEHGNIFEWFHKKEAIEEAGFKYIHGVEAYITEFENTKDKVRDNYHCVLLSRNYQGVKELNRLVSSSFNRADVKCYGNTEQFYYLPRILFDELINTSDNIIVLTGCMGGILSKGNDTIKNRFIRFLCENKKRCFLEVQHHQCEEQKEYNKYLYSLSKKYGIRLVACTDTHSLNDLHKKGRSILQKAKKVYFDNEEDLDLVYKNYDELVSAFKKQNALPESVYMDAIECTNDIVDMVEEFTLDRGTKYPHIYDNPLETYENKIWNAYDKHKYLRDRYDKNMFKNIINNEISVYEKTKSIDFMLLQTYMREWEKKNDIQCGYGRGSVSGSEVAYTLGITQMDSIKFNLNFFRFMNPSRVTNADIDTDYCSKDRDKVKYFLLHDHMDLPQIQSAEIITFNTIALKGAIKDVCRALEIPNDEAQKISDAVELDEKKKWFIPDEWRKKYKEVFEYVDIVVGTVVSIGTHPSGVLVTDRNIYEDIGLCSLSTSKYPVSMLNMKELDALMYVKLDILGLDNIGIINDTCKYLGIERLTPDNTDLYDEDVWRSIRDDTTLIFQFESDSAQAYLKKFMSDETIAIAKKLNKNFSYIKWFSFANGLIRPGCASFRDSVANGENRVTGFKELDDFLSVTMGRICMQEDIMQFLVRFCGYSDAESDTVRRGIAKKYGTEKFIDEIHDRFIEYSSDMYGASKEMLEKIFPPIKQGILDATNYAFSWNHSDAYSCIGYICGYLRYYHPLEFITAALNIFSDKEEKTLSIIKYAQKMKINILPIKFRHSRAEYSFDKSENSIYKGMESVKFLNREISEELYALRDNTYGSFVDLLLDIRNTSINSRQLDILIRLNFFSEFGNINYLLKIVEIFNSIYGKKQFKKDTLDKIGITKELMREYAAKETSKQFLDVNTYKLLLDITVPLKNEITTSVNDIVKYQAEYLGYIDYVDTNLDIRYAVVTDVDTKYSPVIDVYCLKNGKTAKLKISKKRSKYNKYTSVSWSDLPLEKGDIVYLTAMKKKNKQRLNKETDQWEPTSEMEWWLLDYEKEEL